MLTFYFGTYVVLVLAAHYKNVQDNGSQNKDCKTGVIGYKVHLRHGSWHI